MKKLWLYTKIGFKDLVGDVAAALVFLIVYALGTVPLVLVDGLTALKVVWVFVLTLSMIPLRGFVLNKLWRWR